MEELGGGPQLPFVFMLLHNRPGLFVAASQSQRRKAHCSALVPCACGDTAAGTLSFSAVTNGVCQCCGQHGMPLAGHCRQEEALGRKTRGGPEGQTLGTGPHWEQERGVTRCLPPSSPPRPLARLPRGTFLSHTYPPLRFSPTTYTPLFSSPSKPWVPNPRDCSRPSFGSSPLVSWL